MKAKGLKSGNVKNLQRQKKKAQHTQYRRRRRRRLYTQRERREKGRESEEEEDRRLRRLPLPPFLSPSFFWEEEDVLDDERERTLIEIVTPHDYTIIICAQRESTKRARERAKEREKRGEEDGLLLFLSRASFVGSRKRRTPWQTRRI